MIHHKHLEKTLQRRASAHASASTVTQATMPVWLLSVVLLSGATACGAAAPIPELIEARTAYEAAKAGPAADLAPARLEEARQALEQAEAAFEKDKKGESARVTAYIATRRAEIATVRGQEKSHKEELKRLKAEYDELEKKRLTMTQEELAATKEALDKELTARKSAEARLTAAVASLKEMAQVKEEARGVVITLSGAVLFSTGKHQLLPIAKEKLDDVADALSAQGYKKLVVEGHTDSQGSENANADLSLKRAEAVREHLIGHGIDKAKIEAKGLGESRPVVSNDTPEGRANNRRVEIVVE